MKMLPGEGRAPRAVPLEIGRSARRVRRAPAPGRPTPVAGSGTGGRAGRPHQQSPGAAWRGEEHVLNEDFDEDSNEELN